MPYDEGLAQRVEEILDDLELPGLVGKKMFGGIGFMLQGNMSCGVHKDRLVVRVGPEKYEQMLTKPDVALFDITGRPMKGWIMVTPKGYEDDAALQRLVKLGVDFARTLPGK